MFQLPYGYYIAGISGRIIPGLICHSGQVRGARQTTLSCLWYVVALHVVSLVVWDEESGGWRRIGFHF